MKKLLITAATILVTLSSYAQGVVDFKNDAASLILNGLRIAAGSPTDRVAPADGIVVGLYWAPATGPEANVFRQIGANGLINAIPGRFISGQRTTPAAPGSAMDNLFQVRAWEVAYGTTYELAIAAAPMNGRIALRGTSNIFGIATVSDTGSPPPTPNAITPGGMQGFTVNVPEPSTIALGLIGAGALLMLRRRK